MKGEGKKDGRKETERKIKEENVRTKARDRERFLTFETCIHVSRDYHLLLRFTGRRGFSTPRCSRSTSVPLILSGGFSAIGRTEDTIT